MLVLSIYSDYSMPVFPDTKDPPLYYFADVTGPGDVICEEYKGKKKSLKSEQTAIVIDNGSYQCRVGWANQDRPQFVFRNASTKARGKKVCSVTV